MRDVQDAFKISRSTNFMYRYHHNHSLKDKLALILSLVRPDGRAYPFIHMRIWVGDAGEENLGNYSGFDSSLLSSVNLEKCHRENLKSLQRHTVSSLFRTRQR